MFFLDYKLSLSIYLLKYMECKRCLNNDKEYFYLGSKGYYCRKCIAFGRAMIEEDNEAISLNDINEGSEEYELLYPLTSYQKEISDKCAEAIKNNNVLIHAITGSGKTELVIKSISEALKNKKRVGFAIPRRQVVLDLAKRFKGYFINASVIPVCEGYTSIIDGDLIICTTHQLYRYYQIFDLLILDEPDAYPFNNNEVLHGIARTSCKGHIIYLTATPNEELIRKVNNHELVKLTLNRRPHGYPLIIPKVIIFPRVILLFILIKWIKERDKPIMVFVPTISMASQLGYLLKILFPCFICTSKTKNKDEIIEEYLRGNNILICTTIMERGITIKNVDVCVFIANHEIFDEASLTQIAGRVGRVMEYPKGEALFLLNKQSEAVNKSINNMKEANL